MLPMRRMLGRWRLVFLSGASLLAQVHPATTSRATLSLVPHRDGAVDLTVTTAGVDPGFDLATGIQAAVPCDWDIHPRNEAGFSGTCPDMSGAGLQVDRWMVVAPLVITLHQAGFETVDVRVTAGLAVALSAGWEITREGGGTTYRASSHSVSDIPPPLRLAPGGTSNGPTDRPGLLWPLLLVILLPNAVALMLRAAGKSRQPAPSVVWLSWLQLGTWLLWLLVFPPTRVLARLSNLPRGGVRFLLGVPLLALPPLAAYTISFLLLVRGPQNPVSSRGACAAFLRRFLLPEASRAVIFSMAPIAAVLVHQGGQLSFGDLVRGVVGVILLLSVAAFRRRDLCLLEAGEFRSRILQLAKQAGTRLHSIYLIGNRSSHEANAFASVPRRQVLVTTCLLQEFPRREVDALMAHELGHLHGRRAIRVTKVYEAYGVAYVMTLLAMPLVGLGLEYCEPALLLSTVCGFFMVTFISRKWEYQADAHSGRITNDPCALMAALGRLAAMRLTPLSWGPMEGAILSHPSCQSRVLRLASQFQIEERRALQILEDPDALYGPSGEERSPELSARYDAASLFPAGEPCLSPIAKSAHLASSVWLFRALLVLPLMGLSYAISRAPGDYSLQLGMFALCVIPIHLSATVLVQWWHRRFLKKTADRIATKLPATSGGEFVGLWPAADVRPIDGFFAWDVGRIWFTCDDMVYAGERARFSIPRSEVVSVDVVDMPGTRLRRNSLVVRWRQGTLAVQPISGASLRQVQRLKDRWIAPTDGPGGSLPAEMAAMYPDPSAVPNATAAKSVPRRTFLVEAAFLLMLSLAVRGFLPENSLSLTAAWTAPLLYLAALLPRLFLSAGVQHGDVEKSGESRLSRLKEEEGIAVAASRLIQQANESGSGEAAERAYVQACEQCEQLLKMNPRHLLGLKVWSHGLMSQAQKKTRDAADRLYGEAEEKLVLALTIAPEDTNAMARLGHARLRRAMLDVDGRSDELLASARSLFENALRLQPSFDYARILWAHTLSEQSKRAPGPETDSELAAAFASFEAAAGDTDHPARIMRGQAAILLAQGIRASGEDSVRLLRQAKERFVGSESREPGTGAYRAACVCARLGEDDECRQWLEKSREPGVLVTRDELAAESLLEPVRHTDWFQVSIRGRG